MAQGMYYPRISDTISKAEHQKLISFCPGKGYPIKEMGDSLFYDADNYTMELGHWQEASAVRSTDLTIQKNASSGGIMTSIAQFLLSEGLVGGVIVTKIDYTGGGPRTLSYIATSKRELLLAQGSKYCPVPVLEILKDIYNFPGALAFIGTPCQIAGIRLIQKEDSILKNKIRYTIGNFCGGFRDFRETNAIIQRAGIALDRVASFRYRGGGQPGSMEIIDKSGRKVLLKYPDYARLTGYVKHVRCRLCVDATAELADFCCGDAWISRFLKTGKAWSILIIRSPKNIAIIHRMKQTSAIETAALTYDEILSSQKQNIISKKIRQAARRRFMRLVGCRVPDFDGGYSLIAGNILLELWVYIKYTLSEWSEKIMLYPLLAKYLRRNDNVRL
ncbi:MAG: hypothetical protein A2268_13265 [Candidatus Raymondbacteria bacterium RifOxyA12_full_50_37]|uniref:Coenzyme F420 hydrogenase n=1 Tax=Candidatus Raymondbacteria bacterium RIFOXYD12_FULL_49_13 TaxID=1817890 RepID=A0A1F7EZY5_UNCRA|nr:MAG: hypothetical protein A2268_13265 [Candidatus Raymondbacteria bacterium RifOxyA12_full_50_37]OGJ93031.1 MAG: hypothetical protein A2248_18400 [Candidatus Raymondbacteria bacterium RIFOXYA2_FULL_49_16]OGJ94864.1 MAG: hypothetical protein A2350_15455 [Candidatus Raymondbacteria bacterium RifOxyB12_full_50_8]OGJ99944.1 MAG: hypothetical protein A2519_00380 [Candidatus Raymondbacteria bacterium RIFOXYD12_FULL_49_13]OGK04135.1 MAG: hypothetical protein A2487_14060 [Candidatus Raymondbacteria 